MKKMLLKFLSLSALERKGVIALVALMLVLTAINAYLTLHPVPADEKADPELAAELSMFESKLHNKADTLAENIVIDTRVEIDLPADGYFVFDPNHATAEDLRRLGMNNRLAGNLLKYRRHGGKFKNSGDLKKIYGMTPELYARLEPYISIEEKALKAVPATVNKKPERFLSDINQADSVVLEKLPGIGPVLSQRIVRYRNLLGGFYGTEQLKEVYGLSDSVYAQIAHYLYADTLSLRKINLNEASEREMAMHPYIGRYTARAIVLYRTKVARINKLDELTINGLLTTVQLRKLKRYLEI